MSSLDNMLVSFDPEKLGTLTGPYVSDVKTINDGNNLSITLDDGTEKEMGSLIPSPAKNLTSVGLQGDNVLTFTMDDNSVFEAGTLEVKTIVNKAFPEGYGVLTSSGSLKIILTDSTMEITETETSFIISDLTADNFTPIDNQEYLANNYYSENKRLSPKDVAQSIDIPGLDITIFEEIHIKEGYNEVIITLPPSYVDSVMFDFVDLDTGTTFLLKEFENRFKHTEVNKDFRIILDLESPKRFAVKLRAFSYYGDALHIYTSQHVSNVDVTVFRLKVTHHKVNLDKLIEYQPVGGIDSSSYTPANIYLDNQSTDFTYEQLFKWKIGDGYDYYVNDGDKIYAIPNLSNYVLEFDKTTQVTNTFKHEFLDAKFTKHFRAKRKVYMHDTVSNFLFTFNIDTKEIKKLIRPPGTFIRFFYDYALQQVVTRDSAGYLDAIDEVALSTTRIPKVTLPNGELVTFNELEAPAALSVLGNVTVRNIPNALNLYSKIYFNDNLLYEGYEMNGHGGNDNAGITISIKWFTPPYGRMTRAYQGGYKATCRYQYPGAYQPYRSILSLETNSSESYIARQGAEIVAHDPQWWELQRIGGTMPANGYRMVTRSTSNTEASRWNLYGAKSDEIDYLANMRTVSFTGSYYGEGNNNFNFRRLFEADEATSLFDSFNAWQTGAKHGEHVFENLNDLEIKSFTYRNGYVGVGGPAIHVTLSSSDDGVNWVNEPLRNADNKRNIMTNIDNCFYQLTKPLTTNKIKLSTMVARGKGIGNLIPVIKGPDGKPVLYNLENPVDESLTAAVCSNGTRLEVSGTYSSAWAASNIYKPGLYHAFYYQAPAGTEHWVTLEFPEELTIYGFIINTGNYSYINDTMELYTYSNLDWEYVELVYIRRRVKIDNVVLKNWIADVYFTHGYNAVSLFREPKNIKAFSFTSYNDGKQQGYGNLLPIVKLPDGTYDVLRLTLQDEPTGLECTFVGGYSATMSNVLNDTIKVSNNFLLNNVPTVFDTTLPLETENKVTFTFPEVTEVIGFTLTTGVTANTNVYPVIDISQDGINFEELGTINIPSTAAKVTTVDVRLLDVLGIKTGADEFNHLKLLNPSRKRFYKINYYSTHSVTCIARLWLNKATPEDYVLLHRGYKNVSKVADKQDFLFDNPVDYNVYRIEALAGFSGSYWSIGAFRLLNDLPTEPVIEYSKGITSSLTPIKGELELRGDIFNDYNDNDLWPHNVKQESNAFVKSIALTDMNPNVTWISNDAGGPHPIEWLYDNEITVSGMYITLSHVYWYDSGRYRYYQEGPKQIDFQVWNEINQTWETTFTALPNDISENGKSWMQPTVSDLTRRYYKFPEAITLTKARILIYDANSNKMRLNELGLYKLDSIEKDPAKIKDFLIMQQKVYDSKDWKIYLKGEVIEKMYSPSQDLMVDISNNKITDIYKVTTGITSNNKKWSDGGDYIWHDNAIWDEVTVFTKEGPVQMRPDSDELLIWPTNVRNPAFGKTILDSSTNKMIAVPAQFDNIVIFDIDEERARFINSPSLGLTNYAISGYSNYSDAIEVKGKIYLTPYDSDKVTCIYPAGTLLNRKQWINPTDLTVGYVSVPEDSLPSPRYTKFTVSSPLAEKTVTAINPMRTYDVMNLDANDSLNVIDVLPASPELHLQWDFTVPKSMNGIDIQLGSILFPDEIVVMKSDDGITWEELANHVLDVTEQVAWQWLPRISFPEQDIKYLRIVTYQASSIRIARVVPVTSKVSFTTDDYWRAVELQGDKFFAHGNPKIIYKLFKKSIKLSNGNILILPYDATHPILVDTTTDTYTKLENKSFNGTLNKFTYAYSTPAYVVLIQENGTSYKLNDDLTLSMLPIVFGKDTKASCLHKDGNRYFLAENASTLKIVNDLSLLNYDESYGGVTGTANTYGDIVSFGEHLLLIPLLSGKLKLLNIQAKTSSEPYIEKTYSQGMYTNAVRLPDGRIVLGTRACGSEGLSQPFSVLTPSQENSDIPSYYIFKGLEG